MMTRLPHLPTRSRGKKVAYSQRGFWLNLSAPVHPLSCSLVHSYQQHRHWGPGHMLLVVPRSQLSTFFPGSASLSALLQKKPMRLISKSSHNPRKGGASEHLLWGWVCLSAINQTGNTTNLMFTLSAFCFGCRHSALVRNIFTCCGGITVWSWLPQCPELTQKIYLSLWFYKKARSCSMPIWRNEMEKDIP